MRRTFPSECSKFGVGSPKGFSLLELMIVLAIGMILLGFAIPMIQSSVRIYTLNSTATNVTRMMQLARYTAIQQASDACTVLDGGSFGVDADCDGALGNTETAIVLPTGVSLIDAGPAADGMGFSTDPVAMTDPFVITFNSRGIPTTAPTVNLVYLTGWENFRAVTVSGVGRARSWRYENETWN